MRRERGREERSDEKTTATKHNPQLFFFLLPAHTHTHSHHMGAPDRGRGRGPRVVHAARSGRGGGGGGRGGGGDRASAPSLARGFSRLDPATATYYEEAKLALADVADDPEQAALLAGAGVAEAAGREAAVACDAVGSRALEALLPLAPPDAVVTFAGAVLAPDALPDVATRCEGRGERGGGMRC